MACGENKTKVRYRGFTWTVKENEGSNCLLGRENPGGDYITKNRVSCSDCTIPVLSVNQKVALGGTGVITHQHKNGNFKVKLDTGATIASISPDELKPQ